MKDLLIVTSPSSSSHQELLKEWKKALEDKKEQAQLFHETAILLSGPKSFENAIWLHKLAERANLPISLFEIESVLTPSSAPDAKV